MAYNWHTNFKCLLYNWLFAEFFHSWELQMALPTKPSHAKKQYSNLENSRQNCLLVYISTSPWVLSLDIQDWCKDLMQTLIRSLVLNYDNILFISNCFSNLVSKSLSKLKIIIFTFQTNGYDNSEVTLLRIFSMKFIFLP